MGLALNNLQRLICKKKKKKYESQNVAGETERYRGLLWLTPRCNTYIQSLASFTGGLIRSWFSIRLHRLAPKMTCFVYSADFSPWLTPDHWGLKNFGHYIFSGCLHIISSCAIHVIHFCCLLFTLRHSCILFTKSTITGCQWSIYNIPPYLIFQNVHLWKFSRYPPPTLSSPTTYKKYKRNKQQNKTIIIQKALMTSMLFLSVVGYSHMHTSKI